MRRYLIAALAVCAAPACSIPGRLGGEPPPTQAASPAPPTATAPPPTSTSQPPTPTPLPSVITAQNVDGLRVVRSFAQGIVRAVAFSPDGAVLAAAEGDPAASIGTIQLYDPGSGLLVGTLEGHTSGVWGLTFSPDGRYLATAGRDHTAKVWDWRTGTLVTSLEFPNEVVAVAFSPDSRAMAVGGVNEAPGTPLQDAAIWTFDVDTWEPRLELAEYWNIADIAYVPHTSLIVGGGTSRNVRVWKASDGAELFVLNHPGQVGSIAISPDGSVAATATCEQSAAGQCTQGGVWLWDLDKGKLLETLSDFTTGVSEVAFSADASLLFAATPDGTLRAYSTATLEPVLTASAPPSEYVQSISDMAISADGRYIATGGSGRIHIWSVGG